MLLFRVVVMQSDVCNAAFEELSDTRSHPRMFRNDNRQ